jgi:hypothetical protein
LVHEFQNKKIIANKKDDDVFIREQKLLQAFGNCFHRRRKVKKSKPKKLPLHVVRANEINSKRIKNTIKIGKIWERIDKLTVECKRLIDKDPKTPVNRYVGQIRQLYENIPPEFRPTDSVSFVDRIAREFHDYNVMLINRELKNNPTLTAST